MARKTKQMLVAGNWKMNPANKKEMSSLWNALKQKTKNLRGVDIVICPPFPYLSLILAKYQGTKLAFGSQDVSVAEKGSFTGEVSASQIVDLGAQYAIIGHSERRRAGESNSDVQKKIRAVLSMKGLSAIVCVGENTRDTSSGDHLTFINEELKTALADVTEEEMRRIVIAYEPIWAIGKSAKDAMTPHEVHEMSLFIRKALSQLYSIQTAMDARLLYGGSVERENAEALLDGTDIDGFLVGHASLDAGHFAHICAIASEYKRK